MLSNNEILKMIFGFKVRYLRQQEDLSYQELAARTGLSTSYLNDIEKGKKYPKPDKVQALAQAFSIEYDDLVSTKASKKLQPIFDLLNSDFFKLFPLQEFGISPEKLMDVFTNAPDKVNAFISTILKMVRSYQIEQEHFYRIALRSYQDMYDNYFEELEVASREFKLKHQIKGTLPFTSKFLEQTLSNEYNIKVDRDQLSAKENLNEFRSYYSAKKKILYLNKGLSSAQENFLLGRELGFQYLQKEGRPFETRLNKEASFEKLMSNFKASYFSVALLMDENEIVKDIKKIALATKWDPKLITDLMAKYDVTQEMFLQRLTNILPQHFGIKDIFFLRLETTQDLQSYIMTKELHLSQLHSPYNNELHEHFCHRWVSINVLKKMRTYSGQKNTDLVADVQISKYWETTNEYFCVSIAQATAFGNKVPNSVTLGLLITPELQATFNFLKDPKIPYRIVNTTCERCSMPDCDSRVAPPTFIEKANHQLLLENELHTLDDNEKR